VLSRTLDADGVLPPAPEAGGHVRHRKERATRSEVTVVTSAGRSHSDDIGLRQRRYLMTQSVRVACLLLAATLPVPLIWKGVLLAGAAFLPYFGVVMANAGPSRDRRTPPTLAQRAVDEPVRLQIQPSRVIDADG
jgi:hypothetical protein